MTNEMSVESLTEFFAAWNSHDVDRIVACFTPDGAYLASVGPDDDGTAFRGHQDVRRGVSAFLETYSDAAYTDLDMVVTGDRGHATWTFSGTNSQGTVVRYRGVDVFEFSGGLVRLKDAFRKERARPIGA